MNAIDLIQVIFAAVISILVIDVVIIWCGGFPFPMKHKKKFIQIDKYIIQPDTINFIKYYETNNVIYIFFNNGEKLEIALHDYQNDSDILEALNHYNDIITE